MATWDDVRRIAGALPDVEDASSARGCSFKVGGKLFAYASREDGALATRAPQEEVELLIRARPDLYFVTPHYVGWKVVLLRLAEVDEDELAGRIEDAYTFIAQQKRRRR